MQVGEAAGAIRYVDHIRQTYDATQSAAVEACATLAAAPQQVAAQPAAGAADAVVLPIVLIQGPPGTGKTHTVTVRRY